MDCMNDRELLVSCGIGISQMRNEPSLGKDCLPVCARHNLVYKLYGMS
jgi:hypothetical protein